MVVVAVPKTFRAEGFSPFNKVTFVKVFPGTALQWEVGAQIPAAVGEGSILAAKGCLY